MVTRRLGETLLPKAKRRKLIQLLPLYLVLVTYGTGCDALNELLGSGPTPEQQAEQAYAEGRRLMAQGDLDAAEQAFRRGLAADPTNGSPALSLAQLYHQRGEDSRALLELGSAERLVPDSVEIPRLRAEILFGQGRYGQSARSYRQAVARGAPTVVRRRMIIAQVRAGEFESARVELEVLRGIEPSGPAFDAVEGLVRAAEGDILEARRILEAAARAALDGEAPSALGWFLLQQGDPQGAIRALRQAVSQGGNIAVVRLLVEALIDAGEAMDASDMIQPYTISRSRDALVHSAYARALVGQGRYQDALTAANQALRLDPRLAPALLARGAALEAAGDLDAAIQAYRAAAREAPDYTEVYRHLAAAHKKQGHNSDAIAALERLIQIDPADRRGAMVLLDLYVETSVHGQRGLALVNRMLEIDPGDPRLLSYRRRLQAQVAAEPPPRRRDPPGPRGPQIIRGR